MVCSRKNNKFVDELYFYKKWILKEACRFKKILNQLNPSIQISKKRAQTVSNFMGEFKRK